MTRPHCDDDNLLALCQRCHLTHDLGHHGWRRRLTLRLRWAIGDLFEGLYEITHEALNEHNRTAAKTISDAKKAWLDRVLKEAAQRRSGL